MKDGMKFYLMNGRDALTTICFWVKNKTGSRNASGFYYLIRLFFTSFTDLSELTLSTCLAANRISVYMTFI